jgi:hypothetical protein
MFDMPQEEERLLAVSIPLFRAKWASFFLSVSGAVGDARSWKMPASLGSVFAWLHWHRGVCGVLETTVPPHTKTLSTETS